MTAESSLPFDLTILRSFRVLRPLKLVSKVPSKPVPRLHYFLSIILTLANAITFLVIFQIIYRHYRLVVPSYG